MPDATITLSKLKDFIRKIDSGFLSTIVNKRIEEVIIDTISNKIFVSDYSQIYEIVDSGEMRTLIQSGGTPRKGKYNDDYLASKIKKGEPPHVKTGKMKESISVKLGPGGLSVEVSIPYEATTRISYSERLGHGTVYNFMPIHEQRKSVLKASFVLGWHDIMKALREEYLKEIKGR